MSPWRIVCWLCCGAWSVALAQEPPQTAPATTEPSVDTSRPLVLSVNPVGNGDFVGAPHTGSDFVRYDELIFQRLSEIGSRSGRVLASWREIEAEKGKWDFSALDREMALCEKYSIVPVVLIVNIPAWVSPTGKATHEYAPNDENAPDFDNFITKLAQRYKGRARYYEFWNEPNGFGWHVDRLPDGGPWYNRADEYIPWLHRCYQAIKAVDPDAQVAIGGLDDVQGHAPIFVEMAYKMRREQYHNEKFWDAIALHPYNKGESYDPDIALAKLDAVRAMATRYGDQGIPLWITEYGWNTSEVSPEIQKEGTRRFIHRFVGADQKDLIIAQQLAIADFELEHTGFGLCDLNLRPRPACLHFQAFARRELPTMLAPLIYRLHPDQTLQIEGQLVPTMEPEDPPTFVEIFDEQGQRVASAKVKPFRLEVPFRDLPKGVPLLATVSSDFDGKRQPPIWRQPVMMPEGLVVNGGFEGYFRAGIPWGWKTQGQATARDGGSVGPQYRHGGQHSLMLMLFDNARDRSFDDMVEVPVPAGKGDKLALRCFARFFGPAEADATILLSGALIDPEERFPDRAPGRIVGREWTEVSIPLESPCLAPILRLQAVSNELTKARWLLCIDDVTLTR